MTKRKSGLAGDGGLRRWRGRKALDRERPVCDWCQRRDVHWHEGGVREFLKLTDKEVAIINERLQAEGLSPLPEFEGRVIEITQGADVE